MTESTAPVAKMTHIRGWNEYRVTRRCAPAHPLVGTWLAAQHDHALDVEEMAA